jgi:hypothetical protein
MPKNVLFVLLSVACLIFMPMQAESRRSALPAMWTLNSKCTTLQTLGNVFRSCADALGVCFKLWIFYNVQRVQHAGQKTCQYCHGMRENKSDAAISDCTHKIISRTLRCTGRRLLGHPCHSLLHDAITKCL